MKFVKYQALGNDYLVIDPADLAGPLAADQVRRICDRHYGPGSDGILLGPLETCQVPAGRHALVVASQVEPDRCGEVPEPALRPALEHPAPVVEVQLVVHLEEPALLPGWKLVMRFNKYPITPVHGCSRLTIGADNRITHQRDYFDLWGDIFNGIPYFKGPYRRFLRKHFG